LFPAEPCAHERGWEQKIPAALWRRWDFFDRPTHVGCLSEAKAIRLLPNECPTRNAAFYFEDVEIKSHKRLKKSTKHLKMNVKLN